MSKDDQIIYTIPNVVAERVCPLEGFSKNPESMRALDPIYVRWLRRGDAENNPKFRQVIPYVVVTARDGDDVKVLRYKRTKKGGESRLHSQTSIGVGGHMEKFDHDFREAMFREVAMEELSATHKDGGYSVSFEELGIDAYHMQYCGCIRSNASEVDKVHLGVVFSLDVSKHSDLIWGSSDSGISEVEMVSIEELPKDDALESWSRLIVNSGDPRTALRPVFPAEPGGRSPVFEWHTTRGVIARPSKHSSYDYEPVHGETAGMLIQPLSETFERLRLRVE